MRIPCPYCGSRDIGEFVYRGDARAVRPEGDDGAALFEYLYVRDNPMGLHDEHWYHAQGCRNWLVVTRNTLTHEIPAARFAPGANA
jgi:sarcosine oxidase subunit delta